MQILKLFPDAERAREHRKDHGTGGWIFDGEGLVILFPPDITPSGIFNHPVTKGRSGRLIGS